MGLGGERLRDCRGNIVKSKNVCVIACSTRTSGPSDRNLSSARGACLVAKSVTRSVMEDTQPRGEHRPQMVSPKRTMFIQLRVAQCIQAFRSIKIVLRGSTPFQHSDNPIETNTLRRKMRLFRSCAITARVSNRVSTGANETIRNQSLGKIHRTNKDGKGSKMPILVDQFETVE